MLWYAHCNANAVYAYSYTYGYNNADGYSDRNSDSDSYTHADINAQSNAHPEGSAYTEVSSHSGTSTVALLMKRKCPAQLRHRVASTRRISVSAPARHSLSTRRRLARRRECTLAGFSSSAFPYSFI